MTATNTSVRSFLVDHPRMMGALFAMVLLVSQTGTVAAGNGGSIY